MITKFQKLWFSVFILCLIIWFLSSSQYLAIAKYKKRWLLDVNQNREVLFSLKENEKIKSEIFELEEILLNKESTKAKNEFVNERYKKMLNDLALSDVEWEWFLLTISWNIKVSNLIDLINILWFANAKAISVNNIRVNSESFFSVINNAILLNWEILSPILKIAIVWDRKEIEKYFNGNDWIIKNLKNVWIEASLESFDNIKISK